MSSIKWFITAPLLEQSVMLLRGISCQLDMNGAKVPGEEVWFILNGEGFVLKCGFHLGRLKCRSTGIMPSSVMNSLFHQLFRLLCLAAKAYKAPIMKKCLKINQKILYTWFVVSICMR